MPWTLWLIGAVIYGVKKRMWKQTDWQLLACFFISALGILTASSWKHKHYIIPVLAGLAIPTAWYFVRNTYERIDKRLPVFLVPAILTVLAAAGIYFVLHTDRIPLEAVMPIIILIAAAAVLFSAASVFDYFARPDATVITMFAAMWFIGVYFNGFVVGHFDEYRYEAQLGKRISESLDDGETIYAALIGQSQIVYYLRWPVGNIGEVEDMEKLIAENTQDEYHLVLRLPDIEKFLPLGRIEILDEAEKLRSNQESGKLAYVKLRPNR